MCYQALLLRGLLASAMSILMVSNQNALAIGGGDSTRGISPGTNNSDQWSQITVNSLNVWFSNVGFFGSNPLTGGGGFEWPKGSGRTLIYRDGLMYSGSLENRIVANGSMYGSGWQAGNIDSSAMSTDPDDPLNRIYMIRRVSRAQYAALPQEVQKQLRDDFVDWPVGRGMPYVDSNHNGRYDPDFDAWLDDSTTSDKPLYLGDACATFMSNDLDTNRARNLYGSIPVGIEMRTTIWAYDRPGALQNTIFVKHVLINKGQTPLVDARIGRWTDCDLGSWSDDFLAVDSLRRMTIVYNGTPRDAVYGVPPVLGVRMVQAPVRRQPSKTAVYGFGFREGMENVPLQAFGFFVNANSKYRDPAFGVGVSIEMNNLMKGLTANGFSYLNPITNEVTSFPLAGDPLTHVGWVDGIEFGPRDVRSLMSAAPVTMLRGDTQEVAFAYTVVSRPNIREALRALRMESDAVQEFYDNITRLDAIPDVKASVSYPQTDMAVVRVRGTVQGARTCMAHVTYKDGSSVSDFALFDDGMHDDGSAGDAVFAGSVEVARGAAGVDVVVRAVYGDGVEMRWPAGQCLPVAGRARAVLHAVESDHRNYDHNANPGENIRMSVDVNNDTPIALGPWRIDEYGFDPGVPTTVDLPRALSPGEIDGHVYTATDSSSYFTFNVPADARDGEQYFLPVMIEEETNNCWCDSLVLAAHAFATPPEDSLTLHVAGKGTGTMAWRLVSRSALTGHTYRITITGDEYSVNRTCDITDVTTGVVCARDVPFPDVWAHNTPVVDGWKLTAGTTAQGVVDPNILAPATSPGLTCSLPFDSLFSYSPSSNATPFVYSGAASFGTALPWDGYRTVRLVFGSTQSQKAYKYLRGITPNYAYQGYYDVPLSAYDVTDTTAPRRLALAFVELNSNHRNNNAWDPVRAADSEWLIVLDDNYSLAPDPVLTGSSLSRDGKKIHMQYVGNFWLSDSAFSIPEGMTMTITPRVPATQKDVYLLNPHNVISGVTPVLRKESFRIGRIHPQPLVIRGANGQVQIPFETDAAGRYRISVFDQLGRTVARVYEGELAAGAHAFVFEPEGSLAAGMYRVVAEEAGRVISAPLVIVR